MAKKNKITAVAIAKAMELLDVNPAVLKYGEGEGAIEVVVKPRLTLSERAMLVADVVNMVFIDIGGELKYCPAFREFAINFNIVTYFTGITMPADSDKACKFLERSGFAQKITQTLPEEYVAGIISDAIEAIEYRKQELLKKSKLDDILGNILGVIGAIRDKTEGIELPQIMEYIEKNIPEFKGEIEQLISTQAAVDEATTA